jgi:tRNA(fMet)-specific endonuclease VapC
MVILDTDVLTILQRDESKGKAAIRGRRSRMNPAEVATTIIAYEEQARGWMAYVAQARPGRADVAAYTKLMRHLEDYRTINVLPFTDQAAGALQRLRRMGLRMGTMDLKIAAIALVHEAVLLGCNLGHFKRVPDLRVEDWTR